MLRATLLIENVGLDSEIRNEVMIGNSANVQSKLRVYHSNGYLHAVAAGLTRWRSPGEQFYYANIFLVSRHYWPVSLYLRVSR